MLDVFLFLSRSLLYGIIGCSRKQYVFVSVSRQHFLCIAASNVALRKSANQSSTARGGSAMNAIDGDRSVHHDVGGTGGRCSETNKDIGPWWMADLMRTATVNAVRITTRACCGKHDLFFIKLCTNVLRDPPTFTNNHVPR